MFEGHIIKAPIVKDDGKLGLLLIRVAIDWKTQKMVLRSASFRSADDHYCGEPRSIDLKMILPEEVPYAGP